MKLSSDAINQLLRIISEVDAPWWPQGPSEKQKKRLESQDFVIQKKRLHIKTEKEK